MKSNGIWSQPTSRPSLMMSDKQLVVLLLSTYQVHRVLTADMKWSDVGEG